MEGKRLSEEQLKPFFLAQYEEVPGGDGRIVCSYIIEHVQRDRYHKKDICHARAFPSPDYNIDGKPIAIHSSVWKYNEDSKRFIEWIFDPVKSPWRKILTNYALYRDDKGKLVGFSLFDMDKPYRTIMNFLFATRFHSEHDSMLQIFNKALAAGLDEAAAFVLGHGLMELPRKPGQFNFNRYNASHVAIYPTDYMGIDNRFAPCVARLREGNPNDDSPPYWKGKKIQKDVNSIWFDWERQPKCNLFNLSDKMGVPVYSGRFTRAFTAMQDKLGIELQPPNKENRTVSMKLLVERQQEWT